MRAAEVHEHAVAAGDGNDFDLGDGRGGGHGVLLDRLDRSLGKNGYAAAVAACCAADHGTSASGRPVAMNCARLRSTRSAMARRVSCVPLAMWGASRSEERRVGKEGRSRWSPYH